MPSGAVRAVSPALPAGDGCLGTRRQFEVEVLSFIAVRDRSAAAGPALKVSPTYPLEKVKGRLTGWSHDNRHEIAMGWDTVALAVFVVVFMAIVVVLAIRLGR